jgi:uncharacterized membrane protein YphA (DoxX/SURF4 family)
MRIEARPVRIAVTVLSILLALMFLGAGVPKLLGTPDVATGFANYGYPGWFPLVVGVIEVIAAALLLVPRLAWLGAIAVAVVMAGATFTHAVLGEGEGGQAVFTLALLGLAAFVAYARWPRAQPHVADIGRGTASVR